MTRDTSWRKRRARHHRDLTPGDELLKASYQESHTGSV